MVAFFLLLLAFKSMRIRLMESGFLFVAVTSAFLFVLFFLLSYFERTQNDLILAEFFEKISLIPMNTIWISGFYYYEGMVKDRPGLLHSILFLGIYAAALCYIILDIFGFISILNSSMIAIVITLWYGTVFHSFAISVTRKILKMFNRRNIKIDYLSLNMVGIGTFFGGLFFALQVIGLPIESCFWSGAIGGTLIVAGIAVLGFNQYKHGDYIFNTPVPIHVVMIYGEGGQLVYNRNVHPVNVRPLFGNKDILISSALAAFQIFFKELLGTSTQLQRIDAKDYEIFFAPLVREAGTVVLVTSGSNYFLHKGIKKFVGNITEEFAKRLNDSHEISKFDEEIDTILLKSFPFLVIDKERQIK